MFLQVQTGMGAVAAKISSRRLQVVGYSIYLSRYPRPNAIGDDVIARAAMIWVRVKSDASGRLTRGFADFVGWPFVAGDAWSGESCFQIDDDALAAHHHRINAPDDFRRNDRIRNFIRV